jgi:AcrR family transcriptional regulator
LASAEKIIEKGLKAALELAASRPWADIPLADIAARAKLSLSDFHGVAGREDLVEALDGYFDKAMSAEGVPEETSPRERLFDVIMLRFEAMEPYRAGLLELLKFRETSLTHVVRLPGHRHASAAWALASAGLDNDGGAPASLKRIAIAVVIAQAERAWRKEASGDFALTMAALDKGLRRAEERLGQLRRLTGRAPTSKPETEETAT